MSKHDKYYRQQDYEREHEVYEVSQDIAQDQYLPGYIDSGHQAGLAERDSADAFTVPDALPG